MTTTTAEGTRFNESTKKANTETLLSPRFYRTDMKAVDKLNLDPVRSEWTQLMKEFESDSNKNHFKPDENYPNEIQELPPELYAEFMDFLVSSITSEYSGHVLYAEIRKVAQNKDVKDVMGYMARDESRHAGFINVALKHFGIPVNLGFLRKAKKYTYFRPKFIYYATYLSEKIGYARYITIHRLLERSPDRRFHPIFRWFQQWCNDEFRHGEVFALFMKANPKLLRGHNKLWIRFFLLAVFSTMYVRDHARPELHKALGITPTEYDYRVLEITSEITKQIFPFTLNLDDPRFRKGLDKLVRISEASKKAKQQGGLWNRVKVLGLSAQGAMTFARMYTLPTVSNKIPSDVRMAPTW